MCRNDCVWPCMDMTVYGYVWICGYGLCMDMTVYGYVLCMAMYGYDCVWLCMDMTVYGYVWI